MKLRDDDYTCLLYSISLEETVEHLFFECEFSKWCSGELGISWPAGGNRLQLLHASGDVWMQPMFMEIFIVAAWSILKERNNKHFRGITPTRSGWRQRFQGDFGMMKQRVKEALRPFIEKVVGLIDPAV